MVTTVRRLGGVTDRDALVRAGASSGVDGEPAGGGVIAARLA
jgi:hypothetical protein